MKYLLAKRLEVLLIAHTYTHSISSVPIPLNSNFDQTFKLNFSHIFHSVGDDQKKSDKVFVDENWITLYGFNDFLTDFII